VNANYDGTTNERRRSILDVKNIYGVPSQLSAQGDGYANERCMGQGGAYGKVWPPVIEALPGFSPGNVESVLIDRINLRESLNQIGCIAFIPAKSSPNRMGVNSNTQVAGGSLTEISKRGGVRFMTHEVNNEKQRFAATRLFLSGHGCLRIATLLAAGIALANARSFSS
jgi:hypothetical protein